MAGQALKALIGRRPAPRTVTTEARVIRLHGQEVGYVLRRSARRSFGLQVDQRGVRVAVPSQAHEAEVERFILGHADWLLNKMRACAERPQPVRFEPIDGARFPVFGEACRLRLGGPARSSRWRASPDGVEELVLPASVDPRTALVRALRQRALPWFSERVAEYCYRLQRPVPPVRLSGARTRWGSCSTLSGIRLHWRLVHLDPALIDYVVAHEVAHLLEMNHSPRFWAVVDRLYPDWKAARGRLRKAARELPLIEPGSDGGPVNDD